MPDEPIKTQIDEDQTQENRIKPIQDWFLAEILIYTSMGIGFDVILTVSGQTIAGRTISSQMYFDEMARRNDAAADNVKAEYRDTIRRISGFYRKLRMIGMKPDDAPDDFVFSPPSFIHLQDAKIIGEERDIPQGGGLLWRGRLSDVSGFAVGTITRG